MTSQTLTEDAIRLINTENNQLQPRLQVFGISPFGQGAQVTNRYKLELSDGLHVQKATLPRKFNDLILSNEIQEGSILHVTHYSTPTICESRWHVISDLEVLCTKHDIIGVPIFLFKEPEKTINHSFVSPLSTAKNVDQIGTSAHMTHSKLMFGLDASLRKKRHTLTITPFRSLNPYQTMWTIKGRVTMKKEKYHFNSKNGNGHMFSFDIIDTERNEVRITCFNDVADLHFAKVQVGSVYTLSGGTIKSANKFYNKLNSDFEITLTEDSTLSVCDNDLLIPTLRYTFTPIAEIMNMNINSTLDLIGIVICVDPASTIRRRDGTEVVRRILKMVDVSTSTINVTLWGQVAMKEGAQLQEMYNLQKSTVLVIKGGRLAEYNGKVVSTLATSQILVNPDIDEANQLQSWFSEHGHTFLATTPTLLDSPLILARKTITNIEEECPTSSKPLQYIVKATLVFVVRKKFCYPACPLVIAGKQCKKRVEKNSDCKWYCPKCLTTFSDCDYRYVLQVKIKDHTGSLWATAFDETATKLLCMPAKELYMLQFDDNEPDRAEFAIRTAQYNQFLFTITSKMEPYNDELRMNSTILEVARLDFISECTSLFDAIIALVPATEKIMHHT